MCVDQVNNTVPLGATVVLDFITDNPEQESDSNDGKTEITSDEGKVIDTYVGDPINVATGNVYHKESDFVYSDLMKFERFYNSNSSYNGGLGNNWTHTYSATLTNEIATNNRIRVLSPDGKARYYYALPNGSSLMLYDEAGDTLWDYTSFGLGYIELLSNGTKNSYDSSGVLTQIKDKYLDYVVIAHSVEGQDGITTVTDKFGRQIVITDTGNDGHIDLVTDPYGRLYSYHVNSDGNLDYSIMYQGTSDEERLDYDYGYSSTTGLEHKLTSAIVTKDSVGHNLVHWDYDSSPTSLHFGKATSTSIDQGKQFFNHSITYDDNTTATDWTSSVIKTTGASSNTTSNINYSKFCGIYKATSVDGDSSKNPRTYDDLGNLISAEDERGYVTTYLGYDDKGRPGEVVDATGTPSERRTYYYYNYATGEYTDILRNSVLNPSYWAASHNDSDTNNRPTSVIRDGMTRDINGQLVNKVISTGMAYDARGLLTSITDSRGNVTTLTYYDSALGDAAVDNGRLKSVTNPLGHTVTYYDYSSGKPAKIVEDGGKTTLIQYYENGLIESITVQDKETAPSLTRTTHYTYTALGDPATVSMPDGSNYTYDYDPVSNWLTKITDGAGNHVDYEYYLDGKKKSERVFDSSNNLMKAVKMLYDNNDRLQKLTDYNSETSIYQQFTYDGLGNIVTTTDHNGRTVTFMHDELNRLQQTVLPSPDGTLPAITNSYEHDINDKPTAFTDGESNTSGSVYDDFGKLIESHDADGGAVHYEYDPSGNLTKFRDAKGGITAYEYDALGNMTKKTDAQGRHVSFAYYNDGRLKKKTNARGITATYIYNGVGELERIDYSGSTPDVHFKYEADKGRVDYVEVGADRWDYAYDNAGRVQSVDGPWANDTVTYAYDGAGRIKTLTPPSGSSPVGYAYTPLGQLYTVTAGTRTYTYTYDGTPAADPVPSLLTGPGCKTAYTYDNLYRLTNITGEKVGSGQGNIYYNGTYAYNNAHMRNGETVSNAVTMTHATGTTAYSPNSLNQYASTSAGSCSYDLDGNMTQGYTPGGYRFTAVYDAENRLTMITYVDSSSVSHTARFFYGFDGFMYRQIVNGTETRFVSSGGLVLQERDVNNAVTRSYVWDGVSPGGIGGLLSMTDSTGSYSYIYDGKGNVVALVNASGADVAKYRYDEFGVLAGQSTSFVQPYQFSTKMYYPGFGLNYYGYRFLNAGIGHWMSRDPLGEAGGLNLYGFVGNSPMNAVDAWGLWYIDLNMSLGYVGGITGGALISPAGMQLYLGGGLMSPPGGIAITWSPSNPTTGWNAGLQGGMWLGGQGGYGFGEGGGWFGEGGFATPGASLTGYYVWEPIGGPKQMKPERCHENGYE